MKELLVTCHFCGKEITGVIRDVDDKKCCFRCFIPFRQAETKQKKQEKSKRVVTEIRRKKFYCKKCEETKNDVEVNWSIRGIECQKWGNRLWLEARNYKLKFSK